MTPPRPFTGRARRRKTRWAVRAGEVLSRLFITVGGVGTILAVGTICVFLVWVVYPLFLPASVTGQERVDLHLGPGQLVREAARPVHLAVDEEQIMGWALYDDGTALTFRLDKGRVLQRRRLFEGGPKLTAVSGPGKDDDWVFGFEDGTVRPARIEWAISFPPPERLPEDLRDLPPGEVAEFDGGLVQRAPNGRTRLLKLDVQLDLLAKKRVAKPVLLRPGSQSAVRRLDHLGAGEDQVAVCALTEDGDLRLYQLTGEEDPLEGTVEVSVTSQDLFLAPPPSQRRPDHVLLSGTGDNVYAVWDDGLFQRFNAREDKAAARARVLGCLAAPGGVGPYLAAVAQLAGRPTLAESLDLLADGASLTAVQFLLGKTTVLAGDSTGRLRAWFGTKPPDASTPDRVVFRAAHDFAGQGQAVTALAASTRTLMFAAGYADGRVRVLQATSEKRLAELEAAPGRPVQLVALAPRNDGVAALTPEGVWHWRLNPRHPEATLRALFLPVWYEDYAGPAAVWQSSGLEPKLGLWPLVFGTLKATFYSLLIGVPLALLAAVYTSEFLSPRVKAAVKPTIELMASLPSVVLGFLAALVIAPFVDRVLPAFLTAFVAVPAAFLLGAYLWQLLPDKVGLRLARWRIVFIGLAVPAGLLAAAAVGPAVQRLLFEGDVKGWLSGKDRGFGRAASGWLVLLLPVSALVTALAMGRTVNPWLRRRSVHWGRTRSAGADLLKFLAAAALTVAGAWAAGLALDALGFDPRGHLVDKYEQRNSLIVGFVMGFAIIPIIYTIAEDALSAVPEHLRSASLGCGATPWQTATRIVIPTAMSGLFSAVMVGLGRAVGETMIVLMAAGNTPVKDWNVFNGFKTLSAAIAIEMPEAARNTTHFRTLYLAGLVLFGMTFLLNTVAEVVRQRFRRRAYQL